MEKREKRKRGEKQKGMNKKMKRKSEQRKKWWTKKGKMLKEKNETKTGRNKNKKKKVLFLADFSWEKMKREKGLTRNFKNSSTITRTISRTLFFKKKTREHKKKKGQMAGRKNRRCPFQFVGKHFFRYIKTGK